MRFSKPTSKGHRYEQSILTTSKDLVDTAVKDLMEPDRGVLSEIGRHL